MSSITVTLPSALSEAVDDLNQLISVSPDPDQSRQLHCLRELLFDLWEAAIKQELDDATPLYTNAIALLQQAESSATAAQSDITKIADAIRKAATAAKVADQILKTGLNIAQYFP
jgi:hypothetical protein